MDPMQRLLYRKKFLIKPSQRGLVGKVSDYRDLGGKKFRLNRCSASKVFQNGEYAREVPAQQSLFV
jgi:hypothetical protein